jgi:hypothetical protein
MTTTEAEVWLRTDKLQYPHKTDAERLTDYAGSLRLDEREKAAVEAAYEEGYSDGHSDGLGECECE